MNKTIKKVLKVVLIISICLVLIVGGYISYLFISYNRVADNKTLEVTSNNGGSAAVGTTYKMMSYNIGFAAYTPDFSFFMDGGDSSRAKSKQSVIDTTNSIIDLINKENADFVLLEEVDKKSHRSHKVNEAEMIKSSLNGFSSVFAQNWDSPYLFYPVTSPHGKSLTGLLTFSRFNITSSIRRSLPVETGIMKIVDLDRCYSKSRLNTSNGKELVLYTVHLSAYTSDGTIAVDQLKMLINDMKEEYKKGNYVICGGDFNKDLLGDSSKHFGISGEEHTWAQPFPNDMLNNSNLSLVAPINPEKPVPSCRNADAPYNPQQFVVTLDGFIVSSNIEVIKSEVLDTGFAFSDHNPVTLTFKLK